MSEENENVEEVEEIEEAGAPEEEVLDIADIVIQCFATVLDRDPATIKPEDRLEVDLRVNTAQVLKFTIQLEKMTGLKFTIADVRRNRTVNRVIQMVKRYAE